MLSLRASHYSRMVAQYTEEFPIQIYFGILSNFTGRQNMSFLGVRRTSIKNYMEKPVILPKDKPKKVDQL